MMCLGRCSNWIQLLRLYIMHLTSYRTKYKLKNKLSFSVEMWLFFSSRLSMTLYKSWFISLKKHLFISLHQVSVAHGLFAVASVQFSSVQSLSCARLFATPWTAAHQASLSITTSWSFLRLMSIVSVMPSNHLILCHPSSCLQSLPASGSFPVSQLFPSGVQSVGASASASVLPVNVQCWIPLGWTGWISLQPKGLSGIFSSTRVRKHPFFGALILHGGVRGFQLWRASS